MNHRLRLQSENNRVRVYVDDDMNFLLYRSDLRKLGIDCGSCSEDIYIDDSHFEKIKEYLTARARERVYYLIEDSMKTRSQLEHKLRLGGYPDIIIDEVLDYMEELKLVDDFSYCLSFIDCKGKSRSLRRIRNDLRLKGIDKDTIENAIEESGLDDHESLEREVKKKLKKYDLSDKNECGKLYRSLAAKGYSYSDIDDILSGFADISSS